jgi:GNAT superfamily N-acetyltransferase
MNAPTTRVATPDDAAAIGAIHVRTWQAAYRGVMPQEYLDGLDSASRAAGWQRLLSAPPPGDTTLVAEVDGRVVGFANVGPSRDEDATDGEGEVRAIYVDPDSWDSGAGRELMIAGLARLTESGLRHAILWVLVGNERARRFYEAGGWRADGAVKDEESFGVQVSELRYRRPLT